MDKKTAALDIYQYGLRALAEHDPERKVGRSIVPAVNAADF